MKRVASHRALVASALALGIAGAIGGAGLAGVATAQGQPEIDPAAGFRRSGTNADAHRETHACADVRAAADCPPRA